MSSQSIAEAALLHLTVASIADVAPGIKQFELMRAAGELLPPEEGGAQNDVLTGNGVFRSYSLLDWGGATAR